MSAPGDDTSDDNDWVAAMRSGDFARAWAIADRDLAVLVERGPPRHEGPRHQQRIWRGEHLRDRVVLVRCYHGLGDTIQFARFLPALGRIARAVIVWCQAPLLELIESIPGVAKVLPLHEGAPEVSFEVDIEIMELAHALRADRALVSIRAPYLAPAGAPAKLVNHHGSRDHLSVGLVWRVGNWDKRREVPMDVLRSLVLPGVTLCSLQPEIPAADLARLEAIDVSSPDIIRLAQTLLALDLVITVDTMVAHLAGALGCATWIMLHSECDWRWPAIGYQTYWYPTARLFHQRRAGDWSSVVADIARALQQRVRTIAVTPAIRHEAPSRVWARDLAQAPAPAPGGASDSPDGSPQVASGPSSRSR